uniref:Uncharacterized protein n=1 Tax=Marmota marmota marmota TaxID=9994 RepID=A0A8C5ZIW6_MARMA
MKTQIGVNILYIQRYDNCELFHLTAVNQVDKCSLQHSWAKRRAVDWHSLEYPKSSIGILSQEGSYQERRLAAGPQRFFSQEREKKGTKPLVLPSEQWLNSWTILQVSVGNIILLWQRKEGQPISIIITEGSRSYTCALTEGMVREMTEKRHPSVPEATMKHQHVSEASQPAENVSKDLYIKVYPGTYSVIVGSTSLTKKTHVVVLVYWTKLWVNIIFPTLK